MCNTIFRAFLTIFILIMMLTMNQKVSTAFECEDRIGCVTIAPGEPIKIGVLQALSGGAAFWGNEQSKAIQLAFIQRKKQILGHPIQLQIEDEKCSAAGGTTVALKMIADPQIIAILGTTCTNAAKTVMKVLSDSGSGLSMISGANTTPSLTSIEGEQGKDWKPGYLRTALNNIKTGQAAATFVFQQLGIFEVATIRDDQDEYTQAYAEIFGQVFTQLGGKIVLDDLVNKNDTNMRPLLNAIKNSGAKLVFFSLYEQAGAHLVQQAKEIGGFENIPLMGGGPIQTGKFLKAVGVNGKGMYFIGAVPPPTTPASDQFVAAFKSQFGTPPRTPFYGAAYDSANLLFEAIETVAIQENGSVYIGRQALRDALYGTTNFKGISGRLTCSKFGDCGIPRFAIWRLKDPSKGMKGLKSNVIFTYTPDQSIGQTQ